jgi:hypothetical protein
MKQQGGRSEQRENTQKDVESSLFHLHRSKLTCLCLQFAQKKARRDTSEAGLPF